MSAAVDMKIDTTKVDQGIKAFRRSMIENQRTLGRQAGNHMAYRMHVWTNPVSTMAEKWPVKQTKERIAKDVKRAFPSWDDADWERQAYSLIEDKKGRPVANKFWTQYKISQKAPSEKFDIESGEYDVGDFGDDPVKLLKKAKRHLAGMKKTDASKYMAARKPMQGRMFGKSFRPLAMVSKDKQENFSAKQQMRAGLAKAAWRIPAKMIDKQNSGKRSQIGRTGQYRISWPKEANQPIAAAKATGAGSASIVAIEDSVYVKIANRIRYADQAIESGNWDKAIDQAKKAIKIIMDLNIKHSIGLIKKRNKQEKQVA